MSSRSQPAPWRARMCFAPPSLRSALVTENGRRSRSRHPFATRWSNTAWPVCKLQAPARSSRCNEGADCGGTHVSHRPDRAQLEHHDGNRNPGHAARACAHPAGALHLSCEPHAHAQGNQGRAIPCVRWRDETDGQKQRGTVMRIAVIGGGPGGLYFSLLANKQNPAHEIRIYEQNPAGATYGWGVVFSDIGLRFLHEADPEFYNEFTADH